MASDVKKTYNNCQGNGCHERCVLKAFSKDNKVIRTEQTELKSHMADRYKICAKDLISGRFPEIPERLKYPFKRVGERGEGKFERIIWDQAYEEISAKTKDAVDKYGRKSVIVNTFACGLTLNAQGSLSFALSSRFTYATGCSISNNFPVDTAWFLSNVADFGNKYQVGVGSRRIGRIIPPITS